MNMFMNYYREYIQQGFPVKFYFSGSINSGEDDINCILRNEVQGVKRNHFFFMDRIFKDRRSL